jgi:hypothetical protein
MRAVRESFVSHRVSLVHPCIGAKNAQGSKTLLLPALNGGKQVCGTECVAHRFPGFGAFFDSSDSPEEIPGTENTAGAIRSLTLP